MPGDFNPMTDEELVQMDVTENCPHGNRGPFSDRACGCRLLKMPASEVCLHMLVYDRPMWAEPRPGGMVQLYDMGRSKFSIPITKGEAGWHLAP